MELSIPKKFMSQVDMIIMDHLSDETFSIKELSRLLFLSTSQVFRKIKAKTGMNPSTYIKQKRLEAAHELILQTEESIRNIAYSVGFNCNAYFSTCFSEYYGYSPSVLRK